MYQESDSDSDHNDADADYVPSIEEKFDPEYFVNYEEPTTTARGQRKYIIGQVELMSLFDRCRKCGSAAERRIVRECGTAVEVTSQCKSRSCLYVFNWSSQPKHGNMFVFNILLSAAILVSGCCITQFLRAMRLINVAVFSDRTFFYHQKWYLLPATSCIFAAQRTQHFEKEMDLSGDMRCDSPGHTAKFGTYTTIDAKSKKVIHIEVVQKDECANSFAMELEGLKRTLSVLKGYGVSVKRFVSDRQSSVAAYLKNSETIHYFDVWHVAKGIKKQCLKAGKRKNCELIGRWIPSIVKMVYWIASSTPETNDIITDGEQRKQKFQSIYNHIRGIHQHETPLHPKCLHGELEPRDYIQPNTLADEAISKVLNSSYLLKSVRQLSPTIQTYSNESFHQIINHFAPKMHPYRFKGMIARTYLAALHCNENVGRMQRINKEGHDEYSLWFSRAKKDWVAKKHLVDPTFDYAINIIEMAVYMSKSKIKESYYTAEMMCDPGTIAEKLPKPDKTEFVAKLISRFIR